jgi:hypothetical protein
MAKDTFYFSHDYNARNDIKIKKLISKHGFLGYGLYWALIEDLYNNANALPTDYECIAFDLKCNEDVLISIINDYELFTFDSGFFGSLSVQRRLNERNSKSDKARQSAFNRWNLSERNANALQTQCDSNAIKERKGKEKKVNTPIKISFDKSLIFDKNEFKNSFPDWSKEKLKHYYEAAERYSGEGNKYVNWAKAIQGWASKDELQGKLKFNNHTEETETERKIREFKERGF